MSSALSNANPSNPSLLSPMSQSDLFSTPKAPKLKILLERLRNSLQNKFGIEVEVNAYGRGKYVEGKITKDRGNGLYDIIYDDNEIEMKVHESMIRIIN